MLDDALARRCPMASLSYIDGDASPPHRGRVLHVTLGNRLVVLTHTELVVDPHDAERLAELCREILSEWPPSIREVWLALWELNDVDLDYFIESMHLRYGLPSELDPGPLTFIELPLRSDNP